MAEDKVTEAQKSTMKNIVDNLERLSQQKKPKEEPPRFLGQNQKFDVTTIWKTLKAKAETTRDALTTEGSRTAVISFHEALQDQMESLTARADAINKEISDIRMEDKEKKDSQRPEPMRTAPGKNRVPKPMPKIQEQDKTGYLKEELEDLRQAQARISTIEDTLNKAGLRSPKLAPRDPEEAREYVASNIRAINKIIPGNGGNDLSLSNLEKDAVMLAGDNKGFSAEGVKNYNVQIDSSIAAALKNQQSSQAKKDAEAGRAWGDAAERLKNMKEAINKAAQFTQESKKERTQAPDKNVPEKIVTPEKQAMAALFKIVDLSNRDNVNMGSQERQDALSAIDSFSNSALKEEFKNRLGAISEKATVAIEAIGDEEKTKKAAAELRSVIDSAKEYVGSNKNVDPKGVEAGLLHLGRIERELDIVAPKKSTMISPKDEFAHLVPEDMRDLQRLSVVTPDTISVPAGGKQGSSTRLA